MASEFEKNVRRTMEGLRVHPSAEVWQRVEEQIRENKRKRRILFFVIFSLIGLALAGYGIINFPGRPGLNSDVAKVRTSDGLNEAPKNSSSQTTPTVKIIENIPSYSELVKSQKATRTQSLTTNNPLSNNVNHLKVEKGSAEEASNSRQEISSTEKKQFQVDTGQAANSKSLSLDNSQSTHSDYQNKIANPFDSKMIDANDSAVGKTAEGSTSVKKQQMKNQSKWKWGINFSLGASTITQDAFSFKGTSVSDAYALNVPSNANGGGPASGVFYGPSGNNAAFAFKAGFQLKNEISPRSSMSVGLMYAYMADKIKVGQSGGSNQSSSSSRAAYYAATPQNTYTEHFHFIELPLIYDWRMTKNSSRYFSLTGGMSSSYLVSTNALVYDTAQHGIYYQDNSLLTRMHFNLMGGIGYHVSTTKTEFAIGPQFSFDLTKLINSDVDKRKYFLYVGLDTRIFFEKANRK
jgi:outer membrane protein with beta-barrel domain